MGPEGNPVVLFITVGFILVFFFIWLFQSIFKRRKLEDDMERQRDEANDSDAAKDPDSEGKA